VPRVVEVAIEWGRFASCFAGRQVDCGFWRVSIGGWEAVDCVALGKLFVHWDPAGSNGQRPFFLGREVWHIVL
jgi:hypothetical protein